MKTKHTPTPLKLESGEEVQSALVAIANQLGDNDDAADLAEIVNLLDKADQERALACNHHEELVEALEFLAPRIGSMLGRLRYSNTQDAEMLPKINSLLTKLKGQP